MNTQLVATKAIAIMYTSKKIDLGIGKILGNNGFYHSVPMAFFMSPDGVVERSVILSMDVDQKFSEIMTMYLSKMPKDNDDVVEITVVTTSNIHTFKLSLDKRTIAAAEWHRNILSFNADGNLCGIGETGDIIITDKRVLIGDAGRFIYLGEGNIIRGWQIGDTIVAVTETEILYMLLSADVDSYKKYEFGKGTPVIFKTHHIPIDRVSDDEREFITHTETDRMIAVGIGRKTYYIRIPDTIDASPKIICQTCLAVYCGNIRSMVLYSKEEINYDGAASFQSHLVMLTEFGIVIGARPFCTVDGIVGIGSFDDTVRVYLETVEGTLHHKTIS